MIDISTDHVTMMAFKQSRGLLKDFLIIPLKLESFDDGVPADSQCIAPSIVLTPGIEKSISVLQHQSWLQYIPRHMHTVFALPCFVVVIHWLIFPFPSGLLHWHCGNLTIVPVPAKQPWWIWINTSCEFIMNDCITTTKHNKIVCIFLGIYSISVLFLIIMLVNCSDQMNEWT